MCLICIEFQKQRMTVQEGWRAYHEMVESLDPDHALAVRKLLEASENPETPEEKDAPPQQRK